MSADAKGVGEATGGRALDPSRSALGGWYWVAFIISNGEGDCTAALHEDGCRGSTPPAVVSVTCSSMLLEGLMPFPQTPLLFLLPPQNAYS
jgi:hypothetical protein